MGQVIFFTLQPDDYHGAPTVSSFCPPGDFPKPHEENKIYELWMEAGYNVYHQGFDVGFEDDFETDEEYQEAMERWKEGEKERAFPVFQQWANSEIYYYTYLIVTDSDDTERVIEGINEFLGDFSAEREMKSVTAQMFCDDLKSYDKRYGKGNIETVIPINFN